MARRRRNYTREFKVEAVKLVTQEGSWPGPPVPRASAASGEGALPGPARPCPPGRRARRPGG